MSLITTRKLINGEKVTIRCEYISMGWWVAKADDYDRRNGHGQSAEAAADDLTIELNNLHPASLDGLLDAENELNALRSEYLRIRGWRHTCEIGALWLWTKEIKGKTVYLGEDSALQYERMWSDEPREECEG